MENFEKWWYESDFDEELLDPYYFAKNVWKKALEWAREEQDVQCDPYAIDKELSDDIEVVE